MFVYDLWDEWLYHSMLKRSYDMWRSRSDAAPKIGGEEVANAVLKGAFMGLHKRELVEDDDPGDHLPGEAARLLLEQAFNSPAWAEVRQACRGKQSLAAIASASILDTITKIVKEKDDERLKGNGQGRGKRAKQGITSMDKIEQAQEAREQAEHEQELLDVMEQMKGQARTQREQNSIDAQMRKTQAKKDLHDKQAADAEEVGRQAMQEIAAQMKKQIGHVLNETTAKLDAAHDSMEKLAEAGVLDEGIDELDDYDLDEEDDPSEWDDEEREELIYDIGRSGSLKASQKRELAEMSTETLRRIRASSDALKASQSLVKLAEEIGRIKQVFRSAMKPAPIAGNPGGIEGVTYGNKISSLTSAGLATLGSPRLRKIWRLNFVEENLPEREMWGPDMAGRGPIVLALDCSSSMSGTKFFWGKALSIALLSIAKEQERDFAFIGFDDKLVTKIVVPQGKADMSSLVRIEQTPCNGGTSYQVWMEAAAEVIAGRGAFAKADVIVISDGEPGERSYQQDAAGVASNLAYHKRRLDREVREGYRSQEAADEEYESYARSANLWGWWSEQREKLGFRVRGIFIREGRATSVLSQDVLDRARDELAGLKAGAGQARGMSAEYTAERIQACEQEIAVVQHEIKAGFEIVAPLTPDAIKATAGWAYAEGGKHDSGTDYHSAEHRLGRQYNQRGNLLMGIHSAATVMTITCDTWADVSQVADPEATNAVEAEIARMVE